MAAKVVIVGGGIGGLALAQGLRKHGVPFHIYEREHTLDRSAQGYRIRVHKDGVDALQYLLPEGLWELLQLSSADMNPGPLLEIDAQTASMGKVKLAKSSAPSSLTDSFQPCTLDRSVLRTLLLKGLEEHITYGKEAVSYDIKPDEVVVKFRDQRGKTSVANGSILVAADGAHSATRRQFLPDAPLLDTGGRCVYGKTPLTDEVRRVLAPAATLRMCIIKDSSRDHLLSMVLEPVTFPHRAELERQGISCPKDYLYWVMASDPAVVPPGRSNDHAALARSLTADWHESLRPIIDHQARGETSMLPLYSFPPALPVWTPRARLTLIGDAIHVMSPAAGAGAVTALQDAHNLCIALVEEGGTAAAIGDYEAKMRRYAGEAINASFIAGEEIFDQDPWEECDEVSDDET